MTEHRQSCGYERRDAAPRYMAILVGGIAVMIGIAVGAGQLVQRESESLLSPDQVAALHGMAEPVGEAERVVPPSPDVALSALRDEERRWLNSYRWISRERGIVHVPIDRAIDLVIQEGLTTRPAAATQPAKGMDHAIP